MSKKITISEQELREHLYQIISEEIDERFLGIPSRKDLNNKWGYQWDDSLSAKQNRRLRNVNKANIKAQGYRNAGEYEAGEGHAYGEPEDAGYDYDQQVQGPQYPSVYPYKNDRNKTAQFQTWFNLPTSDGGMGGHLVVDGIWGNRTEAAYQQWLNTVNQ